MSHPLSRRNACAAALALGGSLLLRDRDPLAVAEPCASTGNFYGADGKFNPEAAKDAYFTLFRRLGYPFSNALRKTMWVTDFGLGRFQEVGMGGNFWVNDAKHNVASLEMFLLPDQMIPEHWHVAVPDQKMPAKMESWHVRYGSVFAYGEGPATVRPGVTIHASEKPFVTVASETPLQVGLVAGLKRLEEKHWQQAGPQGAVVTEISTFHSGSAVRFANPAIRF